MGWEIIIAGTGGLTIDEHASFDLRTVNSMNEAGKVEFTETFIDIAGEIIESTPSTVADETKKFIELVSKNNDTRDVTLKLDGVTKFEFKKSQNFGSPRVMAHQTISAEGAGDSHWRYGLQIYVKSAAGNTGGGDGNVTRVQTSIKVIKQGDIAHRKVWTAVVEARTIKEALSFVLALKPKADHLHEEIERQFNLRTVSALWVWEARQKADVIELIEEPIRSIGSGRRWISTSQAGVGAAPILHEARLIAERIVVRGVVRGFDAAQVQSAIPSPHYSESDTLKRQRAEEEFELEPTLIDKEKGIFEMRYMEVWLNTGTQTPNATHGDHLPSISTAKLDPPPSDGLIASQ